MYQDYLDDIVSHYREREKNGTLPQRFLNPTPASIKEECVSVFEKGFDQRDNKTLTTFFKVDSDHDVLLRAIHRCDRDRFRPMINFLRKRTNTTEDINIELLGWLIGFQRRPYDPMDYMDPIREKAENNVVEVLVENETDVVVEKQMEMKLNPQLNPVQRGRWRRLTTVGVLLAMILPGYFIVNQNNPEETGTNGNDSFSTNTLFVVPARNTELVYARCTGLSPCKACSNCSNCNWCNSGGSCGVCALTKRKATQPKSTQCAAITKKGVRCKRTAKPGSKYCWQHG